MLLRQYASVIICQRTLKKIQTSLSKRLSNWQVLRQILKAVNQTEFFHILPPFLHPPFSSKNFYSPPMWPYLGKMTPSLHEGGFRLWGPLWPKNLKSRFFPKKSLKSILILSLYAKNHKRSGGQFPIKLETIHFGPILASLGPKT